MLKLKRDVGLFTATMYILGVIVGAGIYVIIGKAAGIAGNSLWLAFLVAAFIAACTGLSYAELSSSFPYDSAEYMYVQKAFRDRRFSFGIGWIKLITHVIAISAVSLGFGGYLAAITGWNFVLCALLFLAVVTVFNLFGIRRALGFDVVMVVVAILGLLVVIGFGLGSVQPLDFYMPSLDSMPGVFTGAALVFFAFLGFDIVGNLGEEIHNPKRNLPLALILSVGIATVLYLLVAVVAVSVLPWETLGQSASPLSDIMVALMGTKAGVVMAVMALAATGSTVLGLVISTSRMFYGMAGERTFPAFFLKVSRKYRVPYWSVILTSVLAALFVLPGDIESIAFLVDFGALFLFMIVNLCLIVLRYTHKHVPRSFRVPLNIGRFPVIPAVGLLTCAALLFSFEKKMFFLGILLFLVGIVFYSMFGERRQKEHLSRLAEHQRRERALRSAIEVPAGRAGGGKRGSKGEGTGVSRNLKGRPVKAGAKKK